MRRIIFIITLTVFLLVINACGITKGSILIKENMRGTGCEIMFSEWSEQNKCEIFLNKNDALQVDIVCESGNLDLDIRSKNGTQAYKGNDLHTGMFTVKVSEVGEYVIVLKGENATGSIIIKNLSR